MTILDRKSYDEGAIRGWLLETFGAVPNFICRYNLAALGAANISQAP